MSVDKDTLDNLTQTYSDHKASYDSLYQDAAEFRKNLLDCNTICSSLDTQISQAKTDLDNISESKKQYTEELASCRLDMGKLDGRIFSQKKELEELGKIRDTDCNKYILQLAQLEAYRDELLEKCKRYETNNTVGDDVVQGMIARTQAAAAKTQQCNCILSGDKGVLNQKTDDDELDWIAKRNSFVAQICYAGSVYRCDTWIPEATLVDSLYSVYDLINYFKKNTNKRGMFTADQTLTDSQVLDIIKIQGQDRNWVLAKIKALGLRPMNM